MNKQMNESGKNDMEINICEYNNDEYILINNVEWELV